MKLTEDVPDLHIEVELMFAIVFGFHDHFFQAFTLTP